MNEIVFLQSLDASALTWLKNEYSDICSAGDVIINAILDSLITGIMPRIDDKSIYFVEHIRASYALYSTGTGADPFWWC